MTAGGLRGVLSPVVTPFREDLSVDLPLFLAHCRFLLESRVGLAVFGTNSEGNSLSAGERADLVAALIESGVSADRMMPGTGGCALPDVVSLTRTCVRAGTGGVLVLPPFYYKGVADDGLFAFFSEVVERVGDDRLRLYLYHIPPVAQVGIPLDVIERLRGRYGPVIAGIKDSGGQWEHTAEMIRRFGPDGFGVFCGSETFLLRTMRAGGAGCISATANVNPAAIADLFEAWDAPGAEAAQRRLDEVREVFSSLPMIAAMKSAIAASREQPGWRLLRPPLTPLSAAQETQLAQNQRAAAFELQAS